MRPFRVQRGSVVLVALSCVTVLSIALAGFLALSNQAMTLSDRLYAKSVSKRLAEMGLERALRSFNADTFSGISWTRSGITANRTFSIDTANYGTKGITTAVNVRVYRYRETNTSSAPFYYRAVPWNMRTSYLAGDFVWYEGVWYLCIASSAANVTPGSDTTKWTGAPESWSPLSNYHPGNIVVSGGAAYQCKAGQAHINQAPPNATYWTVISASVAAWSAGTTYAVNDVVFFGGIAYRCISAHTGQSPPSTTYWLCAPAIYSEGVVTLPDRGATTIRTQVRAALRPAPLFPNAVAATTTTNFAAAGSVDSFNSVLEPVAVPSTSLGSAAVLAGGKTTASAVNITNVRVRGYLAAASATSAPYAPQYATGASGIVTSTASGTPATKIDLTRVSRSPFIPQFDINAVSGAGNLPSGDTSIRYRVTTTLGTAGATTPSIYNITATWATAGGGSIYSGLYLANALDVIQINGPVILNIVGNYFGMGDGRIVIASTGSLEVYFTLSAQMYIGSFGSGGIDNQTRVPSKLFMASTSSNNTSGYYNLQPNATYPFCGVLYMPNAYVSVPSSAVRMHGAISAKNVYFTGDANFHYDTALRNAGSIGTFVDAPYLLNEWRELTDPTEKISLP